MSYTISAPRGNRFPVGWTGVCLVVLLLLTYWLLPLDPPPVVYAQATTSSGLTFDYEMITEDLVVDWSGGGDFDPRDKCPKDFLSAGFIVLSRKIKDRAFTHFLYHRGKRLLYRIDRDIVRGKAQIGLHWVTGTRFNAKYRIGDGTFRGGKTVQVPNGKGGTDAVRFRYGQAVSKKRTQYHRELFSPTHLTPDQCPEWWDLFNFIP